MFLMGNFDGSNYLYRNEGGSNFTEITGQSVVTDNASTLGSSWGDYDNDGDLDLFVANSGGFPARVFRNEGGGSFAQMGFSDLGSITTNIKGSNSCALADYDNDGDLDFYVANSATNTGAPQNNDLYRNNQGNLNNWISLKAVGTVSNFSAVGAKIRIKATVFGNSVWQHRFISGSPTGDRGQNNQRVHFGLGDATLIDSLVIEWPSGVEENYNDLAVNQFLTATENVAITGIDNRQSSLKSFLLKQNYPNPFNPSTTIEFQLSVASVATLEIFDIIGRRVVGNDRNRSLQAGKHEYIWNGTDATGNPVPSGVYFYQLLVDGQNVATRKMVLLK